VSGAYSPTNPAVRTVYYRVNDSQGAFTAATGSGPFTAALSGLAVGFTTVSLFAVDAMEGTSINTAGGGAGGSSSMIGAPTVFAFTVVAPPVISTASPLTGGTVGVPYSQTITTTGGAGVLSYSVSAGALPVGLTLSSVGVLSGAPTASIVAAFTVTVTDSSGGSGNQALALTIGPGAQGSLTVNAASNTVAFGATTTLSTTGGSGSGLVSFASNSANCAIVGSTLTAAAVGSCIVTATKAADVNYLVATGTVQVTVAATVPNAPTSVVATRGNASVSVAFIAPVSNGGIAISGYTATCGTQSSSGAASPIVVSNLSNGTVVTCTVIATNAVGDSVPSIPSNSVTPATVPGAPTINGAVPGNTTATIAFAAPTSAGGVPIIDYTLSCTPGAG